VTEYVVLIVLPAPTSWQSASEAIYGPFATQDDAATLIDAAVTARAARIVVFPLSNGHSGGLVISS